LISCGTNNCLAKWEAGDKTMTVFNNPHMLGFDHFERILDRAAKASAEGYPPYNIEQTGENDLRITLAVAGFTMNDLTVSIEDNQLVIRGKQVDDGANRIFVHRGIAARQFQRSFVLAEGIDVVGATLDNGLLNVDLHREVPEPQIKSIEIKTASSKAQTIDMDAEA
jgi:HSP20 family molecular chaperone IbpA